MDSWSSLSSGPAVRKEVCPCSRAPGLAAWHNWLEEHLPAICHLCRLAVCPATPTPAGWLQRCLMSNAPTFGPQWSAGVGKEEGRTQADPQTWKLEVSTCGVEGPKECRAISRRKQSSHKGRG